MNFEFEENSMGRSATTVQISTEETGTLPEVSVEIFNGKVTTTSLDVAKYFRKLHKNVIRAIERLDCSPEFHELNFEPVEYQDAKNEQRVIYHLTRDGFTFLCMGFTGKEAARWKEAYINAFNRMEQELQNKPAQADYRTQLNFAIQTLDLMCVPLPGRLSTPSKEQTVLAYLGLKSLDQANPEQLQQALALLQGQIIGESNAAKLHSGIAGRTYTLAMLYEVLHLAHDNELKFSFLFENSDCEQFWQDMAEALTKISSRSRDLLGYAVGVEARVPFNLRKKQTH